jgi:hypothetical protein
LALATLAAFAVEARAAADSGNRVAVGPYTTGVADTSAEIRFELGVAAPAKVEVRVTGDAGTKATEIVDAAPSAMHVVVANHLAPATAYSYVVRVGAAAVGDGRFTTAPAPDSREAVHFIAYGDDRSAPDAHAAVVQAMRQVPADFLVNTGDMVADGGSADDWRAFFSIEAPLLHDRPLLVAIGNHELHNDSAGDNFARYFGFGGGPAPPRLYGTIRTGMVRFFFLNAWHDWRSGEERDWLERALAAADGEAHLVWRIAVVHQAPWSVGPHGPNRNLVEAGVPDLLAVHKVDLLLGGHDHLYDRGDAGRVKYVVTGGGGAPLYDIERQDPTSRKAEAAYHFVEITVREDALQIVAHRADGSLLEKCGLPKGLAWDCDPPPKAVEAVANPPPVEGAVPAPAAKTARCGCGVVGRRSAGWPWALACGLAFGSAFRRSRRGSRNALERGCDAWEG